MWIPWPGSFTVLIRTPPSTLVTFLNLDVTLCNPQILTLQSSPAHYSFIHSWDPHSTRICTALESAYSPRTSDRLSRPRLLLPRWLITKVILPIKLVPLHLLLNPVKTIVDRPSPATNPTLCSPSFYLPLTLYEKALQLQDQGGADLSLLNANLPFFHTNHNLCK